MTAVTAEQRCPITELPTTMCAHCRPARDLHDEELLVAASLGKDARNRSEDPAPARRTAQFLSRCPGCALFIHAGDLIVHDQSSRVWVCFACGGGV